MTSASKPVPSSVLSSGQEAAVSQSVCWRMRSATIVTSPPPSPSEASLFRLPGDFCHCELEVRSESGGHALAWSQNLALGVCAARG